MGPSIARPVAASYICRHKYIKKKISIIHDLLAYTSITEGQTVPECHFSINNYTTAFIPYI